MAQPNAEQRQLAASSTPMMAHRPGLIALAWGAAASLVIIALTTGPERHIGVMNWYATIAWSIPLIITLQGIGGIVVARRLTALPRPGPDGRVTDLLIVVIPTIGRDDTLPALARVVTSMAQRLPQGFARFRIDLVVEEGCESLGAINALCARLPGARTIVVPAVYRTPRGTRFKARANQYALELRSREGDSAADAWVLHMDDDTGLSEAAVAELAAFIQRQADSDEPRHLAQGILAYPREHSPNRITWYADAIRPACDLSFFPFTTGRGSPRAGVHGELLCVRASVEAEIGWDFGPNSLVEDAQFALLFCDRHPGGSEWLPAWSEGASPATVRDFVKQRERWMWGLLELMTNPVVPLRRRLLILPNVGLWAVAPAANPVLLTLCAFLFSDRDMGPVTAVVALLWAVNYGFYVWLYWEGFRVNAVASAGDEPGLTRVVEGLVVVVTMPVWCVLECVGILSGALRFLTRSRVQFTVIGKPA